MDPLNEKRTNSVTVRFPDAELTFLDLVRAKEGLSRSELIRSSIPTRLFLRHMKAQIDEYVSTLPSRPASTNTARDFVLRGHAGRDNT